MTELKTLKDMADYGSPRSMGKSNSLPVSFINKNELRQEAIKWVKFIRKLRKRSEPLKALYIDGQVNFIIQFFNLTKEDLK